MKKKPNKYTSVTNLRIAFVPWNIGEKIDWGHKKGPPITREARLNKIAKNKEAYLNGKKAA